MDISSLKAGLHDRPALKYYYHNPRTKAQANVDRFLVDGIALSKGKPFSILPPHNWGLEHEGDREWQVLRKAFFHVDWILQAYIESNLPRYLYLAGENLIDWVNFNIRQNSGNRAKWSDICTGLRGFYFAFVIDRCAREPSCEHMIEALAEGGIAHARELMKPDGQAKSNHAIFQGLGLSSLGSVMQEFHESSDWRRTGSKMLEEIVVAQYGREGVHLEHSPYYHGWVLQRLKRIADLGLLGENSSFVQMVDTCAGNFVHFFRPDGQLSEIGDSSPEKVGWLANMHPALTFAASGGEEGIAPKETDKVFHEAGYAILRDSFIDGLGASYLICHAGHHMRSHKHDDDLTIEWHEQGRGILVDSGKLSYDYNAERDYVVSRRAHNVMEIDGGAGFDPDSPYGAAKMSSGKNFDVKWLRIELPYVRQGCRQVRFLLLAHGRFLMVVDVVQTSTVHDFTQWFHFPPGSEARYVGSHAEIDFPGQVPMTVGLSALSSPSGPIKSFKGDQDPMQGWISPDYAQLIPAPTLGVPYCGTSRILVALLDLRGAGESPIVPIEVNGDENRFHISFRWSESHKPTTFRYAAESLDIDGPRYRSM